MSTSTPRSRPCPATPRAGGALLVLVVMIGLAMAVFMWFAKTMDVSPPLDPTARPTSGAEPFLELGTTQAVVTIIEYSPADLSELTTFLLTQERAALDRSVPAVTVGQTVDLRQFSGVVGRGEIVAMDGTDILQIQGSLTNRVPLASLDAWDRLRTDTTLREKVAHYRALASARRELLALGQLPSNTVSDADSLTVAAEAGDADAQNELGMRHVIGRTPNANPGLGFFLIYQAALEGLPAAQYNLGVLYLRGSAVGQNPEAGARWVCLAARNKWKSAQDFLNEKHVTTERANALANEQEKSVNAEMAAANARLETLRTQTRDAALQAAGRTYRPDGITYADFKLRYFWWRSEAEPTFNTWFDQQGHRHITLPRT